MGKDTWFTGDTHWGHANIIRFSNRPFATVEEHDEALVLNWNAHVKPGDDVFHIGDFAYGNKDAAIEIRKRLNGNIFLIEGNHDSVAHQIRNSFAWYKQYHRIKVLDTEIVLFHYSLEVWDKSHHGAWHLYGHSHNTLPERRDARSFDVGVDAIAARLSGLTQGATPPMGATKPEHYRPFNYDEVAPIMAAKEWKPLPGRVVGASPADTTSQAP